MHSAPQWTAPDRLDARGLGWRGLVPGGGPDLLRSWTPSAPVLLCGGDADPSVFFLNTQLMEQYWATNTPGGQVTVLDVDSSGPPYSDIKDEFRAAKDLIALDAILNGADDGGAAVRQVYHSALVPPFCLLAVTRFFDAY